MKTIKTYLPVFPGFYNTIFEPNNEENEIEYWENETGRELTYDDFNWDYSGYIENISEQCVEILEREINSLGYSFEFIYEKIVSPSFYNYSNDSINITIKASDDDLKRLYSELIEQKDGFQNYLREKYTSCPGFTSFYSNDADDWINEYWDNLEEDMHILGSMLEWLCAAYDIDQWTIYDQLQDNYMTGELIEQE